MERKHNTKVNGENWEEETKKAVWNKAKIIPGYDENVWRRDSCGLVIMYREFGNRETDLGWEVDHITPVIHGGTDELENLQALNWNANEDKGNQLEWYRNRLEYY